MADLDRQDVSDVQVGIVGSGSMGAVCTSALLPDWLTSKGMTLLFQEHGDTVGCYDYDKDAVKKILQEAKEDKSVDEKHVHGFTSLDKLVNAFPKDGKTPRLFVLSLPHGKAVDGILEELLPKIDKGDYVIDAGNEWWADTERRQKKASEKGVHWVSGKVQRRGGGRIREKG